MKMTIAEARSLLEAAGVFYGGDEDDGIKWAQTINLNDALAWACSECQEVADEELPRVGELFFNYGWYGILYWVTKEKTQSGTQFENVKRAIEFVENEERILKEQPSYSSYLFHKTQYTIGATNGKDST